MKSTSRIQDSKGRFRDPGLRDKNVVLQGSKTEKLGSLGSIALFQAPFSQNYHFVQALWRNFETPGIQRPPSIGTLRNDTWKEWWTDLKEWRKVILAMYWHCEMQRSTSTQRAVSRVVVIFFHWSDPWPWGRLVDEIKIGHMSALCRSVSLAISFVLTWPAWDYGISIKMTINCALTKLGWVRWRLILQQPLTS